MRDDRPRQAVLQLDAGSQPVERVLLHATGHLHPVLSLDLAARVLKRVRGVALVREDEEALGVAVQTTHVTKSAHLRR